MSRFATVVILFLIMFSCSQREQRPAGTLFSKIDPPSIGIDFVNDVGSFTEEFNVYTYRNYYNGGGVAIGDINNDDLPDLFFCGNLVDNKLYLNKGDFNFEDITSKAKVASSNVWSTGVSMVDVNGDGLLDIYVCKSGNPEGENRNNELFINNGDLTFTEEAEKWGINDFGLSTHAAFFDFDKDGDLDMYLLNNSFRSVGGYDLRPGQRNERDPEGGNKLYRNEGGHFIDISAEAGIYGSNIGFGLGVTIGDVNRDGWQDIYVSNDFFEKDYLYMNNQHGTFVEDLESQIRELSLGSMGADMADLNNDGYPEIFVTEMLPEREDRLKTKSQFETWDKLQLNMSSGYYRQFSRNVLQLNNGRKPNSESDVHFSEVGRFSGVEATDWSWGALIFDMDNDGYKDLFVANGIYKDLLDQDYINFMANPLTVSRILSKEEEVITKLVEAMPSEPLSNYAFQNNHDLTFTNKAHEWGLHQPGFSNGSAYGDLDNDGDLDLVVNNVNMPPFVYRNNASQNGGHFLTLKLRGKDNNKFALGSQITVKSADFTSYQELAPMRGFESSVDPRIHFGLGDLSKIDQLEIVWPDLSVTTLTDVPVDTILTVTQEHSDEQFSPPQPGNTLMHQIEISGLDFRHTENNHDDFDRDPLLLQMVSNEGAPIATGDVNNDGLADVYVGGAKDQAGVLFLQTKGGNFIKEFTFESESGSEDTDALFFDADGDLDLDLIVTSGGSEFSSSSSWLQDRIYLNDGHGSFTRKRQNFPKSTSSSVSSADIDGDGDFDLFIGTRLIPFLYGVSASSYLLQNNGDGQFSNITSTSAPFLDQIGMVKDGEFFDFDSDGDPDLLIAGEWMGLKLLENNNGIFSDISTAVGLDDTEGFWNSITITDINQDGQPDFVAGNLGLNSRLKASKEKPLELLVNDFDGNGQADQIFTAYNGDSTYPVAMLQDLVGQIPSLRKQFLKYEDYKLKMAGEIFPLDQFDNTVYKKVVTTESAVFLNEERRFRKVPLPYEVQLAPMYAIAVVDLNEDGHLDLIIGGNNYKVKPEIGIYDGSYGFVGIGAGTGEFTSLSASESGFYLPGEIRNILATQILGKDYILISGSDMRLTIYESSNDK